MRGENRHAFGRSPLGPPVPVVAFSARVLFFEFGASSLLLDCLAYEDEGHEGGPDAWRSGVPLTMELAIPAPSWLEFARAAMERWADQSSRLAVELSRHATGPRVCISDGCTSITLEPAIQKSAG